MSQRNFSLSPILDDIVRLIISKRVTLIITLALAVWMIIFAWPGTFGQLKIVFCDVGQGDSILIQRRFHQIIIDGGPPTKALECLERHLPFFDSTIDTVIVSHAQLDHFGGLMGVMDSYKVISLVYNGYAGDSLAWQRFSHQISDEKAKVIAVKSGDRINLGELNLKVVWPEKSPQVLGRTSDREPNQDALVLWLRYGDFDALFTSDIGAREEQAVLQQLDQNSDGRKIDHLKVLKVPHHGSRFSSSQSFLDALRPVLAVIQVGKNTYGHPTPETLERLRQAEAKILRTDQSGDIIVHTNGKTWSVNTQK